MVRSRIGTLARHWDAFGKRDPQWAALTDRRLSPEEFFRSGEDEVRVTLDRARAYGLTVDVARALDFGCGPGRITQALAQHFRACDGVDVARSMIAAANQHNRFPDTCRYHLNTSGDLRLFEDRRFTFIYSMLVLQHMTPDDAKAYIREFLRVLAPGGLLVFQLPSHRGPDDLPDGAPRTLSSRPLPPSACRARISATESSVTTAAGQLLTLPVIVRNDGDRIWPSRGRPDARYQIFVANRWRRADGSALGTDEARCPLPHDLAPHDEARVLLGVNAPAVNGEYDLELDLVQEDVAWFGQRGSPTARVRVKVEGGGPADADRQGRDPAPTAIRRFRARHPRIDHLIKASRIRVFSWTLQYLLVAAKREWEVWRRGHRGVMEMHCIPQAEVADLVRASGGTLIDAETHVMDGGFQSRRYWVTSRS